MIAAFTGFVLIHVKHKQQHDNGHGCAPYECHVNSGFAKGCVVELVSVEVHQDKHYQGGRKYHNAES